MRLASTACRAEAGRTDVRLTLKRGTGMSENREKGTLSEEAILQALRPVMDPEIGMSVVDLGMIRHIVQSEDGKVEIHMVLTTPLCPLASTLTEQVRQAAAAVPGVTEARVTLLRERWDPSWMKR